MKIKLILSSIIVFVFSVLSSIYASMLVPSDYSQAALMSSGIINSVATILLTLFIDPKASVLADRVVKNRGFYVYLKSYSLVMISSKLAGDHLCPASFYTGSILCCLVC
ncbi:DUF2837 family protein [Priestia megaterium]